jgi:hypothetical protein
MFYLTEVTVAQIVQSRRYKRRETQNETETSKRVIKSKGN